MRRATPELTDTTLGCFISIHALREEGDSIYSSDIKASDLFLSTPSVRRATFNNGDKTVTRPISIHALREEGDVGWVMPAIKFFKISIHALREEGD